MARKDRSADPAAIQLAIEAAIQDFAIGEADNIGDQSALAPKGLSRAVFGTQNAVRTFAPAGVSGRSKPGQNDLRKQSALPGMGV